MQDFGVPTVLAFPLGTLLPFAELGVAIALLPTMSAWYGAIGALALLFLFIVGIGVNLSFGRRPDCNCFGQLHSEPIAASTFIRNLILGIVAGLVVWQGAAYHTTGASAVAWIAQLTAAQDIARAVGVVLLALVGVETWMLLETLTRVGKLQAPLELLEDNGIGAGQPLLGLPEGDDAPAFELPNLQGNMVSLSDLLAPGQEEKKPVVLVFTSPACGPRIEILPHVAEWQRLYGDQITFALISQGTVEANLAKTATYNIAPVLLQNDKEVAEAYKVRGTPSAVAIRFDGSIHAEMSEGQDAIIELIMDLTSNSPTSAYEPSPLLEANKPQNGLAFPEPPQVGDAAPNLTLLKLDRSTLNISAFRGAPATLLFFSPSCGWCEKMLKDLLVWERKRPPGTPQLLVISTSGTKLENERMGFKSTLVMDDTPSPYSAARWFKAQGTPNAVLLDENGIVISKLAVGRDEIMELLKPARSRSRARLAAV